MTSAEICKAEGCSKNRQSWGVTKLVEAITVYNRNLVDHLCIDTDGCKVKVRIGKITRVIVDEINT